MRAAVACLIVLTLAGAAGCSGDSPNQPTPTPAPPTGGGGTPAPPATPDPPAGPTPPPAGAARRQDAGSVAFGDSLTEGVVSAPLTLDAGDHPARLPGPAGRGPAGALPRPARHRRLQRRQGRRVRRPTARAGSPTPSRRRAGGAAPDGGRQRHQLPGPARHHRAWSVALEDMIKDAHRRGLRRVRRHAAAAAGRRPATPSARPFVEELNAQIRKTALEEGATVVDVYNAARPLARRPGRPAPDRSRLRPPRRDLRRRHPPGRSRPPPPTVARRRGYNRAVEDLTTGSLSRHLLRTASFMLVTMLSQTLYLLVDLYWVGSLGKEAVAAVGIAGNLSFIVLACTQVLGVGTTTLIAHASGARDGARARDVFHQSQWLAAAAAVAVPDRRDGRPAPLHRDARRRRADGARSPTATCCGSCRRWRCSSCWRRWRRRCAARARSARR